MLTLQTCNLCPRQCGVDRRNTRGYCGVCGDKIRVGRAALHMWEEPCISGERGSGTIFFSGCNLRCIYCQNAALSESCMGKEITESELIEAMLTLQSQGAHNINLVTPTQYSMHIISAVRSAREKGLYLPIVYNTSGYESVDAINSLYGTVSIYLTDYKYADNVLASKYSSAGDYDEIAFSALNAMVRQLGPPHFDREGMMLSGIIVRHLVLPGQLDNSKAVINKIYNAYGDNVIFSIMNQYTSITNSPFPELNRTVSLSEYQEVIKYARDIGVTNAFIQDGKTQRKSFIPKFNGEGI